MQRNCNSTSRVDWFKHLSHLQQPFFVLTENLKKEEMLLLKTKCKTMLYPFQTKWVDTSPTKKSNTPLGVVLSIKSQLLEDVVIGQGLVKQIQRITYLF